MANEDLSKWRGQDGQTLHLHAVRIDLGLRSHKGELRVGLYLHQWKSVMVPLNGQEREETILFPRLTNCYVTPEQAEEIIADLREGLMHLALDEGAPEIEGGEKGLGGSTA